MARTLTPRDISALINAIYKEATGQTVSITNETLTDFVSVGEKILSTGYENTLNALSMVIGRTVVAVRPASAKLDLISALDSGEYTDRFRKISFLTEDAQNAGDWNTQLHTNLGAGLTNGENTGDASPASTKSMWEQNPRTPIELVFGGSSVWQTSVTVYKYQLKKAFANPQDFALFVSGLMTQVANEIALQKEAFNRLTMLNYIAGAIDMGMGVDLVTLFNSTYGTSYTANQIRTGHRKELLELMVSTIKKYSRKFTYQTSAYHFNPTFTGENAGKVILRHTPREDQKLFLAEDLITDAEAMVMPEIFNDQYLSVENYEPVGFWQNLNDPLAIDVTPSVPSADLSAQTAGTRVNKVQIVAVLFDKDAMLTDWQIDDAETTPIEARKRYYNTWYSFAKNAINDFTENGIVFYMSTGE